MTKLLSFLALIGLIVKKKKRVLNLEGTASQAREQIKILKSKGLSLPIMTL